MIRFLIFWGCFGAWLSAQDLLETEPLLGVSFPFEEKEGNVIIPYPILIGDRIVPAQSIARVLYVLPQRGDPEVMKETSKARQESAYSRPREKMTREIPPEILAARRIATETHWTSAQLFRLKLTNQNTPDLRMVYQIPGETDFHEVVLSLIHGLFLGQKEGKVMVLAVEKRSTAFHSGFVAGDEILKINEVEIGGDLKKYWETYYAAKTTAERSPKREIIFSIKSGKEGVPVARTIRVAPSLKGNALDLF